MTVQTSRFFGRPVSAVPQEGLAHDKWALVDALTRAADDYGLSHRSIAVLRAMLTFVPQRELAPRMGLAIVFASNETLSERLGGMPESTLRRHLGHLVDSGIIARVDSPNRKRYARKVSKAVVCAFGFDLAPLAFLAAEIFEKSENRQRRIEERAALHSSILAARQSLLDLLTRQNVDLDDLHDHSPLLARTRLMLRRKDNNEALQSLLNDYRNAMNSAEMSANDSENERHQHNEKNKNSESEVGTAEPTVEAITNTRIFAEYRKFYLSPAGSMTELNQHIYELVPMLGIDLAVYEEAKRIMGQYSASIAVLCILERFDEILNPGGYLRHLTKEARKGTFDIKKLIAVTTNCQVTTHSVDTDQ